jgi:probable addiction module antidote protein
LAEFLKAPEGKAANLEACIGVADEDDLFIIKALAYITPSEGMAQTAPETSLSRDILHKVVIGDRTPSFYSIIKVVSALVFKLIASLKLQGDVLQVLLVMPRPAVVAC